MGKIETRYWKRELSNPYGEKETIYFSTDTNSAHSRAEGDPYAKECGIKEFSENVPKEVSSTDKQTMQVVDPLLGKQQAWEALQAWTHSHGDIVAIQDQIAMLELWKHQLCIWATSTMTEHRQKGATNNVN